MDRIKAIDVDAYEWLAKKRPHEWSRSHFRDHCKCDVLLNNWCESFNGADMLLQAREKPILSCLVHIQKYLMKKWSLQLIHVSKWFGELGDRVHKILERNKLQSGWCHVISNGHSKFQITLGMGGQFSVDLVNNSCSCRAWDLNGIPCAHAVAAIYHEGHGPLDYVNTFYKKEIMMKAYSFEHVPIADPKEWPKTSSQPITPPNNRRQPGRPKRIRKRELEEPAPPNATKLRKYNVEMFCKKCKQQGHNTRTCGRRKQEAKKKKKKAKNFNSTRINQSHL
ncbi:hypothetical protein UlMin_037403 [Ulmus minor]